MSGVQSSTQDTYDIGDVVQSPVDKEALSGGAWMGLDGSDSLKTIMCTALQTAWPVGVMTSTARTLAATPAAAVIASSPTYFVASAAAGTTAAQYSTDGATWSQTSLASPASCQVNCLLYTTGASTPRWVFGCSGSANPCVTTGDNPNSTWTACTGAVTTTLQHGLAHSSSLNLTLLIPNGAGTAVWTMPGTDTTFTSRAVTNANKMGGCWDGTYFVIVTQTAGLVQRSTDGITWTDIYASGMYTDVGGIASNGAGIIVATVNANYVGHVLVSTDSGSTWKRIFLPSELCLSQDTGGNIGNPIYLRLSYANGKFVLNSATLTTSTTFWSVTGEFWVAEPIARRGIAATPVNGVAHKSSVYVGVTTSTAALSATESATLFRRPTSIRGDVTTQYPLNYQEYMKVK